MYILQKVGSQLNSFLSRDGFVSILLNNLDVRVLHCFPGRRVHVFNQSSDIMKEIVQEESPSIKSPSGRRVGTVSPRPIRTPRARPSGRAPARRAIGGGTKRGRGSLQATQANQGLPSRALPSGRLWPRPRSTRSRSAGDGCAPAGGAGLRARATGARPASPSHATSNLFLRLPH